MITITQNQAKALLVFMAKKDVRYYLNGAYVQFQGLTPRMIATDGYRIIKFSLTEAIKQVGEAITDDKLSFIIPQPLIEAIAKSKGVSTLWIAPNFEGIKAKTRIITVILNNGQTITAPEINGVFPDVDRVIPSIIEPSRNLAFINPQYVLDVFTAAKLLGIDGALRPYIQAITSNQLNMRLIKQNPENTTMYDQLSVSDQINCVIGAHSLGNGVVFVESPDEAKKSADFESTTFVVMPMKH